MSHERAARSVRAVILATSVALRPAALASQEPTLNPHGTLPSDLDCAACHTSEGWTPVRSTLAFTHGTRSGFELTGAHVRTECRACHLDLRFDGPEIGPNECGECHADVHEGRMIRSCPECHGTRSFGDVDGELIHASTSFPLTGAHRQVTCEACHANDVGGSFTPLSTDCMSCHAADYTGARTVDHVANDYPTDCTRCHTAVGWSDSPVFDHPSVSGGFALVAAHAGLRCASCHRVPGLEPLFTPASQDDCIACHQAAFDGAHGGTGFPTTCLDCHNQTSWEESSFDHAVTGFPLQGAHRRRSCSSCHGPPRFLSTLPSGPLDCFACHEPEYNRVHGGTGTPTTCFECHNQSSWDDDAPAPAPRLEGYWIHPRSRG